MEYAAGSESSQALSFCESKKSSKSFSPKPSALSTALRFDLVACAIHRRAAAPLLKTGDNFWKTTSLSGTPEGTRTPNLLIRSQTLYPIELRVHARCAGEEMSPFGALLSRFLVSPSKKSAAASAVNQKSFVIQITSVLKREAIGIRGGTKCARRARWWDRNFPSGQKFAP